MKDENRLIQMMLSPTAPKPNQSKCRECVFYIAANGYCGHCKHYPVVLANDLTCYRAEFPKSL